MREITLTSLAGEPVQVSVDMMREIKDKKAARIIGFLSIAELEDIKVKETVPEIMEKIREVSDNVDKR